MGLGFGIRDPEKIYSGSRIQGSKRHRIPDSGSGSATLPGSTSNGTPYLNLASSHIQVSKYRYRTCVQD
jgi:hypothetical protein